MVPTSARNLAHLERGYVSLLDIAIHDVLCLWADHKNGLSNGQRRKAQCLFARPTFPISQFSDRWRSLNVSGGSKGGWSKGNEVIIRFWFVVTLSVTRP